VVQLHRASHAIEAANATLHVIGNGAPRFIAGFREDTGYDGSLYTDPSLEVYRAADMRRGVGAILHPRALLHGVRAMRGGFRQQKLMGDATQIGGVLIVTPRGEIPYRYMAREAGDHPPNEDILAALERVAH